MTARFRSAFSGSSGYVAARPLARLVEATHAGLQAAVAVPARQKSCQGKSGQGKSGQGKAGQGKAGRAKAA